MSPKYSSGRTSQAPADSAQQKTQIEATKQPDKKRDPGFFDIDQLLSRLEEYEADLDLAKISFRQQKRYAQFIQDAAAIGRPDIEPGSGCQYGRRRNLPMLRTDPGRSESKLPLVSTPISAFPPRSASLGQRMRPRELPESMPQQVSNFANVGTDGTSPTLDGMTRHRRSVFARTGATSAPSKSSTRPDVSKELAVRSNIPEKNVSPINPGQFLLDSPLTLVASEDHVQFKHEPVGMRLDDEDRIRREPELLSTRGGATVLGWPSLPRSRPDFLLDPPVKYRKDLAFVPANRLSKSNLHMLSSHERSVSTSSFGSRPKVRRRFSLFRTRRRSWDETDEVLDLYFTDQQLEEMQSQSPKKRAPSLFRSWTRKKQKEKRIAS